MNQEKHKYDQDTIELVEEGKSLLLLNDDVNTFDYVIETLVKVCKHTYEQAETCAMITHYKGNVLLSRVLTKNLNHIILVC